jgi:hypothetical protein
MSSLALLRVLKLAPARYDAGMRVLTLDEQIRDALAEGPAPLPGTRALYLGLESAWGLVIEVAAMGNSL